ncbi:hypothetical protein BUALT_Bualt04G0127200 [Buddleja alternifolia]|uniref:DUF4216 domain-containing protein n=1 Tax=Buddleja alternifolia TaxID=168488 RepID=A0AAV6XWP1_9LAMI|nr:hypothetical protein BUALT_Bualt04G0127200 [Buddleja alternifolia]
MILIQSLARTMLNCPLPSASLQGWGTILPLNYEKWSDMPISRHDAIWNDVQANTTLPLEARKVVLTNLNLIWKDWKKDLKALHYTPHKDDPEDHVDEIDKEVANLNIGVQKEIKGSSTNSITVESNEYSQALMAIITTFWAFTMGKREKDISCKVLKSIRAPDARRALVNVVSALIEFASFWKQLCSKANTRATLQKLQDRITLTLCNLEKIFVSSFFDIMEHLPTHLVDEASNGGPVLFRYLHMAAIKTEIRNASKREIDSIRPMQHFMSGLSPMFILRASTNSYVSAKDKNSLLGQVPYYGILTDIIEIQYAYNMKFILFKCDWVDNDKGGLMEAAYHFKLVNFNRLMYRNNLPSDEPFILSNQAEQVWYVSDPMDTEWNVAVTMARRDDFDVYSRMYETEPYGNQLFGDRISLNDDDANWVRDGVEGILVDVNDSEHYDEDGDCDEVD